MPDVSEVEDVQYGVQVAQKKTGLELLPLVNLLDQQPNVFLPNHHWGPRFLPIVYDPAIGEVCPKFRQM